MFMTEKKEKSFEKKLKPNQKLALERIYRLFELATKTTEEKYSKRYLQLAKRIGEKCRVSIPKEIKENYCKKCFSLNVEQTKKEPFLIVKCKKCGFTKRFGLEDKAKVRGKK